MSQWTTNIYSYYYNEPCLCFLATEVLIRIDTLVFAALNVFTTDWKVRVSINLPSGNLCCEVIDRSSVLSLSHQFIGGT